MGIAQSVVCYPTTLVYTSSSTSSNNEFKDYKNAFDGDLSTDTYHSASFDPLNLIFSGFDFSFLPSNAAITNIAIYARGSMGLNGRGSVQIGLGKDHTSKFNYTDFGDGLLTYWSTTSTEEFTKNYPAATATCNVDFLKENNLLLVVIAEYSTYFNEIQVIVTYEIPTFAITVNASPTTGGTVTGGGSYYEGDSVALTATPNTGYKFKQWSDGNTSNPRTITVTGNATYTAQFERLTYNITATVSPANSGTVSGVGIYSHGDTATLTATPATGFQFVQWSDGVTNPTRTQTVTSAASFTAIFEKVATSNVFAGTNRQTAYGGISKQSVYIGTKKIT